MGRSQVLYNRTKGRFRNKVRDHQSQQPQQPQQPHNDHHPRGYHQDQPRQGKEDNNSYESNHGKSADKKRARTRSTIGQNTTINESEMLLLADSAAPQYYVEDDTSTIFGGGKDKEKENKPKDPFATSASSLDIASLETTLLTCVSVMDRLKLPAHVAQSLQKEGSSMVVTTTISSCNSGFSSMMRTIDARGEADSEDMVRNARLRKQLVGESPTNMTIAPPANVASPELVENDSKEEDSFLASLSLADDDESADVIRPSYSGIQERGRTNLPAAPSLIYGATSSIIQTKYNNNKKKGNDDASYSIGPDKIKATEQGDIEVRMKKDDASRQSREFDIDRYAVIDEDDEDSLTTTDQRLPNSMRNVHVPKNRNRIAQPASGKLDPPTTTKDPPAGMIPPLRADPSDDSEMLENWLDDIVGVDAASSAAVHHPMDTDRDAVADRIGRAAPGNKNGPPVSSFPDFVGGTISNNASPMSQATAMPKEVTIPQRPVMVNALNHATAVPVDPRPTPPQEEVEDTLESWLDDVIM